MQSPFAVVVSGRQLVAVSFSSLFLLGLSGCFTTPLYPPKLTPAERHTVIDGVTNLAKSSTPAPSGTDRAVRVFAQPIQLPETDANWKQHEYSIYVWASHPSYPGLEIRKLIDLGLLQLDFTGAELRDARVGDTQRSAAELKRQNFSGDPSAAIRNGQVLELVVRAGDILEPIRVAAWFPSEYRIALAHARAQTGNGADNDKFNGTTTTFGPANWSDQAFVPIRSGDLTTRIEIVDQIEARAAFGDEFPRHFYVGRIYLRNTNSTKKLIVYTTSMRAPVYLYRRTDLDKVTKQDSKHSEGGGAKRPTASKLDETTTTKTTTTVSTSPGHPGCPDDAPCKLSRPKQEQYPASPIFKSSPAVVMTRLLADIPDLSPIPEKDENNDPALHKVRLALQAWLDTELRRLRQKLTDTENDLKAASPTAPLEGSKPAQNIKAAIEAAWTALRDDPKLPEDTYQKFAEAVAQLGVADSAKPLAAARKLADLHHTRIEVQNQIDFLSGKPAPDNNHDLAVRILARALAAGLIPQPNASSPFSDASGLSVGLIDQTSPITADQRVATQRVLFSQNPAEQRCLDHLGYIWRDTNRPLTFQAVLNSLILTQEKAARTTWFKGIDFVGRVAGGLISLGTVEEEFARQGYARIVAFYASVITPELGALLLEDLKTHVRNLGEMSMDTIMVIPPRSVEDRYVFFPRGPVYNHPDEFDQHSPAYIVKILSDDIAVQAELVEDSVTVNGPGLDADALVARFNTGTAPTSALLARQAQVRAQAANGELSLTLGKIESALVKHAAIPETEKVKRTVAENEARRLIRDFQIAHGNLGDSAFAELFAQYGLNSDDTPPSLDALPDLRLIAGAVGASRPLPVKDDRTPPAELVIKATVAGEKLTWRATPDATGKTISYLADSAGVKLAAKTPTDPTPSEEQRNVTLSIKDSSGNGITAEQSITLFPLAAEFALVPGEIAGRTLKFPDAETSRPTLSITIPLHDTATEGWTVSITGDRGLLALPARVPLLLATPGRVGASVALDASELKDANGADATSATLTLRFLQGDREIHTQTLTVNTQ